MKMIIKDKNGGEVSVLPHHDMDSKGSYTIYYRAPKIPRGSYTTAGLSDGCYVVDESGNETFIRFEKIAFRRGNGALEYYENA